MTYWNVFFLGLFLPLTIIIYNMVKQKNRWKVLLIASYIFFWSISGKLIIYLLFTTFAMHYLGLWITSIQNEKEEALKLVEKDKKKEIKQIYEKKKRKIVIFAVLVQLGI